jgi:hypothetical protein
MQKDSTQNSSGDDPTPMTRDMKFSSGVQCELYYVTSVTSELMRFLT